MAETQKVAFTENALDEETQVSYYRGQVEEVPLESAGRLVSSGVATPVDEEALKQQTSDELDTTAEALGVDLSGANKKDDKAKKIAGAGAGEK
ncbi:MAG: hypothetical protein WKF67_07810 [Rubrobacteraceae bacterium]